jgi:hypothetical protein
MGGKNISGKVVCIIAFNKRKMQQTEKVEFEFPRSSLASVALSSYKNDDKQHACHRFNFSPTVQRALKKLYG